MFDRHSVKRLSPTVEESETDQPVTNEVSGLTDEMVYLLPVCRGHGDRTDAPTADTEICWCSSADIVAVDSRAIIRTLNAAGTQSNKIDKRGGQIWRGRTREAGPAPAAQIGVERELGDDQRATCNVNQGAIDLSIVVGEDAHTRDLVGKQARFGRAVRGSGAHQDHETRGWVEDANHLITHEHAARGGALDDSPHSAPAYSDLPDVVDVDEAVAPVEFPDEESARDADAAALDPVSDAVPVGVPDDAAAGFSVLSAAVLDADDGSPAERSLEERLSVL